jgi:hypothetical protein
LREHQIASFAKLHGWRLRFYKDGFCAIFDKDPSSLKRHYGWVQPSRRFKFDKRAELVVGADNKPLSVAAVRVNNPDCSPLRVNSMPAAVFSYRWKPLASKPQMHVCEVTPGKDKCGVDLIFDMLRFGRLCYGEPNAVSNAISYANFFSRSHDAVIRVYDEAGNVIEAHEQSGESKHWRGPHIYC